LLALVVVGVGIVILTVTSWFVLWLVTPKYPPPLPGASLLISGAGTGFGRLTSLKMAERGFKVYSGVLTEEEGNLLKEELKKEYPKCAGSITPVILDITNKQHVDSAFQLLQAQLPEGLNMLMNNAGIAWCAPMELQPFEDFEKIINVNLLGHVRMTQTFLPLLRRAPSARIVNITSVAGRIAGPQFSAYSASKFALEAVTDSLRREVRHLGISVSAIEPGFAKTGILATGAEYSPSLLTKASQELQDAYFPILKNHAKVFEHVWSQAMDPSNVVDKAIIPALVSPCPRTRYLVGKDAHVVNFMQWLLPDSCVDLLIALVHLL